MHTFLRHASPKASDTVKVHYRGTLPDGKERGAGGVIPPNATRLFEVELLGINGK